MTIISIILVLIRLKTVGTSTELKRIVYKRHIIYAIFYISFLIEALKTIFFGDIIKGDKAFYIDDWIELVFAPFGIILAIIRMAEPFVWKTFKTEIQKALKSLKSRNQKFENESLDSFLNSCMNIEYVYLLLVGI